MVDIYIITNMVNGKEYVGITKQGYLKRFRSHINLSKRNDKKRKKVIHYAIAKYGEENFKVELLEQVDTYEEAKVLEVEYIKKFNTYFKSYLNWGYNMTYGGDGKGISYITENQRLKMREISLNLHKDPIFREKFLNSMRSEKHRRSVSIANSGAKNGMYGNGHLISGDKNYWYGKTGSESANYGNKYSVEAKDKIRDNTLYHWENNEEFRNNNLKHIKELGEKQRGLDNPAVKPTFLYDENMLFVGEYSMKEVYSIVGCCPSTARKHKDSNVVYNGYYIYSNKINSINIEE